MEQPAPFADIAHVRFSWQFIKFSVHTILFFTFRRERRQKMRGLNLMVESEQRVRLSDPLTRGPQTHSRDTWYSTFTAVCVCVFFILIPYIFYLYVLQLGRFKVTDCKSNHLLLAPPQMVPLNSTCSAPTLLSPKRQKEPKSNFLLINRMAAVYGPLLKQCFCAFSRGFAWGVYFRNCFFGGSVVGDFDWFWVGV